MGELKLLTLYSGNNLGYAFYKGEVLTGYGREVIDDLQDLMFKIKALIEKYEPNAVAVEDRYLSKSSRSVKGLTGIRSTIETLAAVRGIKVYLVHPMSWMSGVPGNEFPGKGRSAVREVSERMAKLIYSVVADQDVARVIMIGRYQVGKIN